MNSERKITLKKQKVLNIALCSLLVVLSLFTASYAESPHEEYKQIQKDIKTHKKKLESVKRVEKSVLVELRKTNAELN